MDNNDLVARVTSSTSILVAPTSGNDDLSGSIYAINWFNLKKSIGYKFYTKLASPLVGEVGGKLIFKGKHLQTLSGLQEHKRKMLLIVNYPGVSAFLALVSKKLFQVYSIIRVLSVKNFVFGFTRAEVITPLTITSDKPGSKSYLVLHYQLDGSMNNPAIADIISGTPVNIFFYGKKAGNLLRKQEGKEVVKVPFFMDGIMVLEADKEEQLISLVESDSFKVFTESHQSNYIALFDRLE